MQEEFFRSCGGLNVLICNAKRNQFNNPFNQNSYAPPWHGLRCYRLVVLCGHWTRQALLSWTAWAILAAFWYPIRLRFGKLKTVLVEQISTINHNNNWASLFSCCLFLCCCFKSNTRWQAPPVSLYDVVQTSPPSIQDIFSALFLDREMCTLHVRVHRYMSTSSVKSHLSASWTSHDFKPECPTVSMWRTPASKDQARFMGVKQNQKQFILIPVRPKQRKNLSFCTPAKVRNGKKHWPIPIRHDTTPKKGSNLRQDLGNLGLSRASRAARTAV